MTHKKLPIEILCSNCGTGFRLWVPAATAQEWGGEGEKISCVKCGAKHTVLKGPKGFEVATERDEAARREGHANQQKTPAPEKPAAEVMETVLLIDDDKLAREMVKNAMKDVGIRLASAQNSAEAIKFVKSEPVRPWREGTTQSNKSIPRAAPSIKSSGIPTPIRYRGFEAGSSGTVTSSMPYISGFDSPTDSPPTA